MAKSLRSKIKRRWRKLKRGQIDRIVGKERQEKIAQTLNAVALDLQYRQKQPKNAFLHPNQPDSKFPQVKMNPMIDLRSSAIPGAGREWSGANRKQKTITKSYKKPEQLQEQSQNEQNENMHHQQKMQEEKVRVNKQKTGYKAKVNKKSKLRRTIVF